MMRSNASDNRCVETDESQHALDGRRMFRLAAISVAGIVVGLVAALRWLHGATRAQIPTQGLIFFGVFFAVGGLVFLVPGVGQRMVEPSTWSGRTVFGKPPSRHALPAWRRALWDLQNVLIARERRQREHIRRDPRPFQLRASATALSLGVTIPLYAALR
jgi:hypothetical protein